VAPNGKESDFVREKLASYGYKVSATDPNFLARLERAQNWARDIDTISTREISIEGKERDAVLELAGVINASNDEAYLQNVVFTIAKKHGFEPGRFFKTLYRILIGADSGPRLGPYILAMGRENVAAALVAAARTSKE
jgi:lysyl-tRNA synthetase class 1